MSVKLLDLTLELSILVGEFLNVESLLISLLNKTGDFLVHGVELMVLVLEVLLQESVIFLLLVESSILVEDMLLVLLVLLVPLLLLLSQVSDRSFVRFDLLLQILFDGLEKLGVSFKLGVLFLQLFNLGLSCEDLVFLLLKISLQHDYSLVLLDPDLLQILNLLILLVDFLLQLLLGSHESLDLVVLSHGETRALLNDLVQLGNLLFESVDDLSCLLLLGLGSLNELPAFVNFSSEHTDGVRIFLSQLDSSLDSGSIRQDRVVQVLASKFEFK